MGIKEDFQDLTPAKCLMAGLVLAAAYYFIVFDKGTIFDEQSVALQTEMDGMNERLRKVQDALENKNSFEEKAGAITKELVELLKFFPSDANINDFQKDVTALLKKTNNQLFRIQEEEVPSRFPGYTEAGVRLEMQGGYNEIMDFLSLLTQKSRMIDYKLMMFSNEGSTDEFSQVKLNILLTVFSSSGEIKPSTPEAGG